MIGKLLSRVLTTESRLPENVPEGVVVLRGIWIPRIGGWLSGMRTPAAAVTLGTVIVVSPGIAITRRLLRHELAHVRQWKRAPLLFPLRYVVEHIKHGYDDNPYEVEARAAEL